VFRPPGCTEHPEACWVSHGPPAISGSGICHGCKDAPLATPLRLPVDAQARQ
jgi:hypothetical protein